MSQSIIFLVHIIINFIQLHFGSGFVLEQFDGDPNKTLISYLADVRSLQSLYQRH